MDRPAPQDRPPVERMRGSESLPAELRDALAAVATVRDIAPGALLVSQHTPVAQIVVLLSGRTSTLVEFTGIGDLAVESSGQVGRIFGWSALYPPYRAVDSVRAETACTVISLPADRVRAVVDGEPAWAAAFYGLIAGVLADRTRDIALGQRPPTVDPGGVAPVDVADFADAAEAADGA